MNEDRYNPRYRECFGTLALGLLPLFLLLGIAGANGSNTVSWNGQNVYGASAILVAMLLLLLFSALLAGLQKLGYLMLGLVRRRQVPAS